MSELAAAALDDFLNILLGELEERLMLEERLRLRLRLSEKVGGLRAKSSEF